MDKINMTLEESVMRYKMFLMNEYYSEIYSTIQKENKYLIVDLSAFKKYEKTIYERLINNPSKTIEDAQYSIKYIEIPTTKKIDASRIIINLRDDKKELLRYSFPDICRDGLLTFSGKIISKDSVIIHYISTYSQCASCGKIEYIRQNKFTYQKPKKCKYCKSEQFTIVEKVMDDVQYIKLKLDDLFRCESQNVVMLRLKGYMVHPDIEPLFNIGHDVIVTGYLYRLPCRENKNHVFNALHMEHSDPA